MGTTAVAGQGGAAAGHPWVRVGAYALIIDEKGHLLLVRGSASEDGVRRWWLPGGGLEFGEEPEVAVLRELAEETGLEGRVEGLAGIVSTVYATSPERPGAPVQVVGVVYRVRVTGGVLRSETDGSTDRCAWLAPEEAATLPLSDGARLGLRLARPDLA